jgi:sugar/nucleoside kinase (ribokinase family)
MRVVCVGLATVDLVYRVDRFPGPDEKVQAGATEIAAGGPALNAAVAAAALGADVALVSAVGAHALGDLVRADLDACGVALLDAAPHSPAPPPVSAVTVLAGTGQRSVVSRNAGDVAVGVPEGFAGIVAGADVVLVDGHHPVLAAVAARAGRRLVVDAGSWRPVFAEVLPFADVAACSATFRHPATGDGTSTALALREAGVRRVAITHGPEPVRWWSDAGSGEVPVPPVPAVDTAGAGDVFHGALAVAVGRDAGFVEALRFAVAVAGIRVTYPGARVWLGDPRLVALGG